MHSLPRYTEVGALLFTLIPRPFTSFTPPAASHPWLTSVEPPLNATYQSLQKELSVLFGHVSLPRQNKASPVIQSRHSLAPSSEAIPTRRIIIQQGQQLINSSRAMSPLCVLMTPAYVLDAVAGLFCLLALPLCPLCLLFFHLSIYACHLGTHLIFPIYLLNRWSYLFVVQVHTPSESRWCWKVKNSLVGRLVHHICTVSTFLRLKLYCPANYPHPQQVAVVIPLSEAGQWTTTTQQPQQAAHLLTTTGNGRMC